MGIEDPGFNHGGFRGSISVGKVNQPLVSFPRVPPNAPTLRGNLPRTVKSFILPSMTRINLRMLQAA